jgi:hypothetical protein
MAVCTPGSDAPAYEFLDTATTATTEIISNNNISFTIFSVSLY